MKKQVLIADADEQFRNELVTGLEGNEEFEVMGVAVDGQEALQIARENRPDIIILDLLLPQYDGISVLDLISYDILTAKCLLQLALSATILYLHWQQDGFLLC